MGSRVGALHPVLIGVLALVLELALITPWVDQAADKNPTVHYTQHGLIFLGGLLMGYALRALWRE